MFLNGIALKLLFSKEQMRCNQVANCGFIGLLDREAEYANSSPVIKKQFRKSTPEQDINS